MAATLSLDTITSSGTNIEIPTGKVLKIADAGALKINDIAITTGAQGVLSKTATYPIVAGDFTGKSSLIVFVDVSAGSGTAANITLPAAADFSTCAIHVVSTAAHGVDNSVVIKLGAVEQYTLYKKGDHCEFVSDGTNVFRTGNEYATVCGLVALTGDVSIAGNSYGDVFNAADAASYSVEEDLGGGWSIVNDDYTVPYTGRYWFGGNCPNNGYGSGWYIYKNGTALTQAYDTTTQYGTSNTSNLDVNLTAGDVITWWSVTTETGAQLTGGDAAKDEAQAMWRMVRRY
tara:strand:- start:285 stop:1148 length:864 start_codon:yes stop_codon:yes gene_type:complete